MTRTGDREIRSVSGRLPDNPGELARVPQELSVMNLPAFHPYKNGRRFSRVVTCFYIMYATFKLPYSTGIPISICQ